MAAMAMYEQEMPACAKLRAVERPAKRGRVSTTTTENSSPLLFACLRTCSSRDELQTAAN